MKKILFINALAILLILENPCYISAQNVGVSGFGLIPNPSALLDVDAAGMVPKGVLIPRITLASITDVATIPTPANSLLVYNTGTGTLSPAGYYYNQGTTVVANWIPFLTNNVNTLAAWSLTGNTGTASSTAAYGATVTNNFIGTTDTKDFVFATDNKERMRITSTGYIGIGTQTPATKLELKDVANTELIRLNNSTNSTTSGFYSGAGSPEGVVTANMASIFADQANGKIYKKSTGSGNTGWNEMVGATAHMAKMTRNAAQTIPSGWGPYRIEFDNTEFDVGSLAHPSSNADPSLNYTFKIVRAGRYLVSTFWRQTSTAMTNHFVYIYKNGVPMAASIRGGGGVSSMTSLITDVLDLAAGDYLEMFVFQDGGALNTDVTASEKPRMSVIELSGTLAGDVVGPASSTDNAIVRFDGTSGKTLQNSGVIIDDANNVSGVVSLAVGGSLKLKTTTITGNTTLSDAHNVVLADPTGDITITLPLASASTDKIYYIKKVDAAGDVVTIDGNGAETIDLTATIQLYEQFDYVRIICDGAKWHIVDGFHEINPKVSEGRLTLSTGTAVTTSDVTGASATFVYFTPYTGNEIALFDGAKWYMRKFSEPFIAVPSTTDKNFDIFICDIAGTLTLETVDWTDNTNRATAITLQDGVYVKSGATTRRYLGTCRTTAVSGRTEDSVTKRFVWNNYNRVSRTLLRNEGQLVWYYSGTSWQQANVNSANKVEFVTGVSIIVNARVTVTLGGSTGAGYVGIGIDVTSTNSATGSNFSGGADWGSHNAYYSGYLTGYHALNWIEATQNTYTITFVGTNSGGGNPTIASISGISGFIDM